MAHVFTLFSDMYATSGVVREAAWDEWRAAFVEHNETTLPKSKIPCIVLGRMHDGARRMNKNVLTIEALALDIERKNAHGVTDDPHAFDARARQALARLDPYEFVVWTTYSHADDDPRLRLVVPLAAPLTPDRYSFAMSYLNCLTGSIGDPGAQKLSQPVFLAYHPTGSPAFASARAGELLDLTTPLAAEVVAVRTTLGEGRGCAPADAAIRQACKAVLLGQPFAAEGARDETALRIMFHISKRHREVSREALELVFRWSLEAMGFGAPTIDNLHSKLTSGAAKVEIAAAAEPAAAPNDGQPYIIQHKANYYFKRAEGGYSRAHTKDEARSAAFKYLRRFQNVQLTYVQPNGQSKRRGIQDLVDLYGDLPDEAIIDVAARNSELRGGVFREATVRWPADLEAHADPQIAHWLSLLGGDSLLDWLSLFADLSRLLSALVIMGEPNSGKTLLAMGLARRLGSDAPANQESLTGAFHEELARCPLIYIDEEITESVYGRSFLAAIRNEISVRERSVNRKYLPAMQMVGAIRCIISANHLPFQAKNSSTGQDLKAIAERFHWVSAGKDAAEFLATISPEVKEEWRRRGIAQHVMHLEQTREVGGESRFGVPGDSEKLADLINIGVRWNAWVTEWICNGALDAFKRLRTGDPDVQGGAFVHEGRIYVRVKTVVKAWETYLPNSKVPPDTRPISDALKGISDARVKPADLGVEGNNQFRFYRVRNSPLSTWLEETGSGTAAELSASLVRDTTTKEKK